MANTPVTGQRPSHKMDFMTPIDTTRSLSLSHFPTVAVPLSRPVGCPPMPYIGPYLSREGGFASPCRSFEQTPCFEKIPTDLFSVCFFKDNNIISFSIPIPIEVSHIYYFIFL